jgi:hypothetical protein
VPQPPQLFESELVLTHTVPQSVCPEGQPPPVPAVPGLLPVDGLLQAAATTTKKSPKSDARPVFITGEIPG